MGAQAQELHAGLRALRERAEAAQRRTHQPFSQRGLEIAVQAVQGAEGFDHRRVNDWAPEAFEKFKVPGPDRSGAVLGLVTVWSRWAGDPVQYEVWRALLRRAAKEREDESQEARGHQEPLAVVVSAPVGTPMDVFREDPFALEVHRALTPDTPSTDHLPLLPAYVAREVDHRLEQVLDQVAGGRSQIAVLVGGSSTGKTRACWEAVRSLPDGWRLWHPLVPSRPEALLAGVGAIGPRTVVWLNELQHYLRAGGPMGEHVAAQLRALLLDVERGPVLVLGTLWPQYWNDLTAPADPLGADPHAQARELLAGAGIHVPDAFNARELRVVREQGRRDPRLAVAVERAESGQITQFLAGVPELISRYEHADAAARAVLDAAMDARRLGCGTEIPLALLEVGAEGYLTDAEWDRLGDGDWLEQALAYAARPLHGIRGPLTRIRRRRGEASPMQPHYRLSDILDQYGRRARSARPVPAAMWSALADHAAPDDLSELVDAADDRGLLRIADLLRARAVEEGDAWTAWALGETRKDEGDVDAAVAWYARAVDLGMPDAAMNAAETLHEAGRIEEALVWFDRVASWGQPYAAVRAADMLQTAGREAEALAWRIRGEAYDPDVMLAVARTLEEQGRADEALQWLSERAERGYAAHALTDLLVRLNRRDEAVDWWKRMAEDGDASSALRLGDHFREAGQPQEALAWYRRAVDGGMPTAVPPVAELLLSLGRREEALAFYGQRIEQGDGHVLSDAVALLAELDRIDDLSDWCQRALTAGHDWVMAYLARQLADRGGTKKITPWLLDVARAGHDEALLLWTDVLYEAGQEETALRELTEQAAGGRTAAIWKAAEMCETADPQAAITWYQRAAALGEAKGWLHAGNLLERLGRAGEALSCYRRAEDAGRLFLHRGTAAARLKDLAPSSEDTLREAIALRRPREVAVVAEVLHTAGRVEEAISFLRQAAQEGQPQAVGLLADALLDAGETSEAVHWYKQAADIDQNPTRWKAAEVLEQAGRGQEAIAWLEERADSGDLDAATPLISLLERQGRRDEALAWCHHAGALGEPVHRAALELLRACGKHTQADQLERYGWEADGTIAQPWQSLVPRLPLPRSSPNAG